MRQGSYAALIASEAYDLHCRFKVGATDLSDRIYSLSLDLPNPSVPVGALRVSLVRETANPQASLVPIIASQLNPGGDPLLQVGNSVILEVAFTAEGGDRPDDTAAWDEVFRGRITSVDWGRWRSRQVRIRAMDQAHLLALDKAEAEHTYATGTSVEATIRAILDNNGFSSVAVSFPSPTNSVLVTDYEPGFQTTVWAQIWAVLTGIGWVAQYRYANDGSLSLRCFQPSRTKVVPDVTISRWGDFRRLSISEDEIRNVGFLKYFDASGEAQQIGPQVNAASVVKYGGGAPGIRRKFWIVLGKESPIRNNAGASNLLAAALSDLSDPDAIGSVETLPNPYIECGEDLFRWKAKGRLFSSDQDLAPFSSRMTVGPGGARSITKVRGKPSSGFDTWRRIVTTVQPMMSRWN